MPSSDESDRLLSDRKYMDGPVVKWTVSDLFVGNNKLFMAYHVMGTPWDVFSPVGSILGGILYGIRVRPYPSLLASMGTVGLIAGCGGMILATTRMSSIAAKGEGASPPWTEDGIQQRVDGIRHNFKVRVLDLSAWSGIGVASVALAMAGGPAKFWLSAGVMGVLQGLTLGSSLGSLAAFGCIYMTLPKKDDDVDDPAEE